MSWTQARARLAAAERHHPGADTSELRRQLRAERLAKTITSTLIEMPPLTAQERCRLAALLLSDGASA
ncbi:hypothetical protein [Actinoplanes sp. NPDC026623]|uniref:hypothetical protein n=1 Tax=Actinoplanes sp. NPDC026623 TaxID=3155610 RepID=UPI0033FD59E9